MMLEERIAMAKKEWRVEEAPEGWYVITPKGHRESGPWQSEGWARQHIPQKSGSNSVNAVSGGVPSLGKRSR